MTRLKRTRRHHPTIAINHQKTIGVLNREASSLLREKHFLAVGVTPDGLIFLAPIEVPAGTESVCRIMPEGPNTAARIALQRAVQAAGYPPGRYACSWEDGRLIVDPAPLE